MADIRYCLKCDDGTVLEPGARDMTEQVDGINVTVPQVHGWHCPVCGECEFDDGEGKRYSAMLAEARRATTEKRAGELRAIRRRLGLKQAEAARLFGGGINAFSEYECGKTQPHKSTVLLLRLLDKHPELLKELG